MSDPKKTMPVLFSNERTKLLAHRISQLERGADSLVKPEDIPDSPYIPEHIAIKELELNQIPMKVVRCLPDGTKEYWKTEEFEYK
jgi:DNA-directed RNA polymerase subunit K/omega